MTQIIAPFKRNKGKGVPNLNSLKQIETLMLEEQAAFHETVADIQSLIQSVNAWRPRLIRPGSIKMNQINKRLIRDNRKTDFGHGIKRIYLRWIYLPETEPARGELNTVSAPLCNYPVLKDKMLAQFPMDAHKILGQLEFERLTIIHRIRNHIEVFNWLTDLYEVQQDMVIRS